MKMVIKLSSYLMIIMSLSSPQVASQDTSNIIGIFEGEWEGNATAYFPRDKNRENREEVVKAECKKILKDTYIQCSTSWTRTDGRTRTLMIFLNYDNENKNHEILFIYDNWPGKVKYKLYYNEEERKFTGSDTFTAPGGIAAEERVEWFISTDGSEIRCIEYNHYVTDADGYWPKTFEFIWRRKK
jgi:hypothetical protein